jgi:hypothetical protein
MNRSPGALWDDLEHGDPAAVFAVAAAAEQYERETERWNSLYKALGNLGDLMAELWSQ